MPKEKVEGIVAYYCFWGWEYLRRNSEYIADYKRYLALDNVGKDKKAEVNHDHDLVATKVLKSRIDFFMKYSRWPTDPNLGINSKELLVEIEKSWDEDKTFNSESLFKMLRKIDRFNYFSGSTIAYRDGTKTNALRYVQRGLGFSGFLNMLGGTKPAPATPKLLIEIDLSENIDLLLREVKYCYYNSIRRNLADFKVSSSQPEPDVTEVRWDQLDEQEVKEKEFMAWMEREEWWWGKIKAGLRYPIKSRAYGLWLWDYEKENNCDFSEARKAFTERIKKSKERFAENIIKHQKPIDDYNDGVFEHNKLLKKQGVVGEKFNEKRKTIKSHNSNTDTAHYHIDLNDEDNIKRINSCLRKAEECIDQGRVLTMN